MFGIESDRFSVNLLGSDTTILLVIIRPRLLIKITNRCRKGECTHMHVHVMKCKDNDIRFLFWLLRQEMEIKQPLSIYVILFNKIH